MGTNAVAGGRNPPTLRRISSPNCAMGRAHLPRVFCIGCSSTVFERLHQCLRHSDLSVISAITSEQAVANCVANMINLAIIDCDAMPGRQWSVAQSLKMVWPALPVILLEKDEKHSKSRARNGRPPRRSDDALWERRIRCFTRTVSCW